ncbi:MAG: sensor histidine kinase [Geminicoccaceae bacterium]|nr:MAG: sensor histidine kinase [Geminicoccaceae bacterium]
MSIRRLTGTTAFRQALIYVGLLLASLGLALGGVKIIAERSIEAESENAITAEIEGLAAVYGQRGLPALVNEIERRSAQPYRGGIYLLVNPLGERLAGNLAGWEGPPTVQEGSIAFSVEPPGEAQVRAQARTFALEGGYVLMVGRTLAAQDGFQRALNRGLLIAFIGALVIGIAGGLILARETERRIEAMNVAIDRVRAGALEVRLPQRRGGGDEFDRLASQINRLLAESEALIRGMRQVTDDVAHDLRTPLQRLHTRLEDALALQGEGPARDMIEAALDDLDRLLRLFRTVLLINTAESGSPKQSFQDVSLTAIAADACELYEAVLEDIGLELETDLEADIRLAGHGALLAQAIANLLDNAAKFTPRGGKVTVRLTAGDPAVVTVSDTGPGIPRERRDEVRRRFTRLDSARETPGHGLGLALVDAVARLHGGHLELDDAAPGLVARLVLARNPIHRW